MSVADASPCDAQLEGERQAAARAKGDTCCGEEIFYTLGKFFYGKAAADEKEKGDVAEQK